MCTTSARAMARYQCQLMATQMGRRGVQGGGDDATGSTSQDLCIAHQRLHAQLAAHPPCPRCAPPSSPPSWWPGRLVRTHSAVIADVLNKLRSFKPREQWCEGQALLLACALPSGHASSMPAESYKSVRIWRVGRKLRGIESVRDLHIENVDLTQFLLWLLQCM